MTNSTNHATAIIHVDFQKLLEQDWPPIRGKFGARYSKEVPCPFCGGNTRFRYRAPNGDYGERVFCSHCAPKGLSVVGYVMRRYNLDKDGAIAWLTNKPQIVGSRPVPKKEPEKPLDPQLAVEYHNTPGSWRDYYHARGINDWLIDEYILGYHPGWKRYSIPHWQVHDTTGEWELHAIQYRIRPEAQKWCEANGKKVSKYLSETGGHNHRLFNHYFVDRELPYVLVVEGVLDSIMLRRYDRPAVAAFHGNNISKAWDTRWNHWLRRVDTVIVIPDNDTNGMGDLIALSKLNDIPRSRIHRLPDGIKDIGEMVKPWLPFGDEEVNRRLSEWLERPPIRDL